MLIALGHEKRVGKDTVADYLVNVFGFTRVSFALKLKLIVKDIYPNLNEKQLFGDEKDMFDTMIEMSPRDAMIRVGTTLRNHFGENVFVKAVEQWLDKLDGLNVIVTDVRYPNEFEMIRARKGNLIKLVRKTTEEKIKHVSETGLQNAKWDFVVENNGTKEELYETFTHVLDTIERQQQAV